MTPITTDRSPFAQFSEPMTLTLTRTLPGPLERVWSYLADSELRRQWLASGVIEPRAGASFELLWRNDELSASASERPEGFGDASRAVCTVVSIDAPRHLRFNWPGVGEVTFDLEAVGDEVVLTVTHRRLADRKMTLMVGAGWHMHADILAALLRDEAPGSFWSGWLRLQAEYDRRLPV